MRNQWAHACQVIPFMTETTEPVARPARHRKHLNPLEGSLLDKILLFALPLALSSLLQQLCNSIDVAVIGKFSSSEALAAVGTNGPVIGLMVNLFIGISVGANVVIANYIGLKNVQGIRNTISTVGVLSLIFGGVLMVAGMIIARPVLVWLDTPENILDMAVLYLRIFFLGMPFMIFYNFGSAILRSIGDTRRPLYCLIVSSIVHTVMNLVLVICFDMSVAGVAIAAAISFMTSAAMVLFILMREADPYRMHLMHSRIHWPELSRILRIGVPAGVQGVVFSVANLFIQFRNLQLFCRTGVRQCRRHVYRAELRGTPDGPVPAYFLACTWPVGFGAGDHGISLRLAESVFHLVFHIGSGCGGICRGADGTFADAPVHHCRYRDSGGCLAGTRPFGIADGTDGVRYLSAASFVDLSGLSALSFFRCAADRLSCFMDRDRRAGMGRLSSGQPPAVCRSLTEIGTALFERFPALSGAVGRNP